MKHKNLIWSLSILVTLFILVGGVYYVYGSKINRATKQTITISSYAVQPDDLKALAQMSDLVVEGVVKSIQPAVWTTPDGLPPADVSQAIRNPDIQLRTPILISVKQVKKGEISGDLLFSMVGGETAQHSVKVLEDDRQLAVGDQIIVFLKKAPDNAGAWSKISPYYPEYFFIVNEDRLVGTQKTIERSKLESQLLNFEEVK